MSAEAISVDDMRRLVEIARNIKPTIKPVVSDDGHEYYLMWSAVSGAEALARLPYGWTMRAITFHGGEFVGYEPCRIDELEIAERNA